MTCIKCGKDSAVETRSLLQFNRKVQATPDGGTDTASTQTQEIPIGIIRVCACSGCIKALAWKKRGSALLYFVVVTAIVCVAAYLLRNFGIAWIGALFVVGGSFVKMCKEFFSAGKNARMLGAAECTITSCRKLGYIPKEFFLYVDPMAQGMMNARGFPLIKTSDFDPDTISFTSEALADEYRKGDVLQ